MLTILFEKVFNILIHRKWSWGKGVFDPARISRILMVRNDNVGDVLCSTPTIRALRKAFPNAYMAALVVRYSQDAILGNPDLDEVFIYEKAQHRPDQSRIVSLYKQLKLELFLKKKRFGLAIGMRSAFSWSEAWWVYFTGARYRLGYSPETEKDRRFSFFYNLGIDPHPSDRHEVKKTLGLIRAIGVTPRETHLYVAIPEGEREKVSSFLKKHSIDPDRLIGFHLSSRVSANRWCVENFTSLAKRLVEHDKQFVVLTWGPGDEVLAKIVGQKVGEGVFSFPTPNFKRLGALQERCRVFLSPDGGAMHFATAVGTSTIGLFGKTDPREWGPWGGGHVALQRGKSAGLITVDEVYQTLKKWIKN